MISRPCLDCGRIVVGPPVGGKGTRCRDCAARRRRTHRPVSWQERERRAAAVRAHREQHGDWCPGWHRPPHAADDLTADHVTPVGAGGREDGPLAVLCRSCNSSKQDQVG